jgi:hypothetical protein
VGKNNVSALIVLAQFDLNTDDTDWMDLHGFFIALKGRNRSASGEAQREISGMKMARHEITPITL